MFRLTEWAPNTQDIIELTETELLLKERMVDIGFQGQHAKMKTRITTGIQSAQIGRLLWLDVIAYQSW